MKLESFINRVAPHVSDAEHIFLRRGLKTRRGNMSRFYTLAKVHKFPLQLRPIVATCGTAQSALSQWLDYILQQLIPYVGIHFKDSEALRIMLTELDELPPNAYLIKADARKMYTCIDTIHGLAILRQFLEELEAQGDLPVHFNIDLIVEAAALVMRFNIFEYGDCSTSNSYVVLQWVHLLLLCGPSSTTGGMKSTPLSPNMEINYFY